MIAEAVTAHTPTTRPTLRHVFVTLVIPAPFRLLRTLGAILGLGLCSGTALRAQESDIIRGRVFGPDSVPLRGVTVTATGYRSQTTRTTQTNDRGSFTIIFRDGGDAYAVAAMAIGFVPQRRDVVRDENAIALPIVDFVLERTVQRLAPIQITAGRPRPDREDAPRTDVGAGDTQTLVATGGATTGDPTGDILATLATIPGLVITTDAAGQPIISALGLAGGDNVVTMNGLTMAGGSVPRDGMVAQVTTMSADPGRRGGGGVAVNFFTPSGSNTPRRTLRVSAEAPSLQWTDPVANGVGAKYQRGIVSGQLSGPIRENRSHYNISYQLTHRASDLASLLSGNDASLSALGVSPDSLGRLMDIAGAFGIPPRTPSVPGNRTSTSGSLLTRLDFSPSATTSFNLTLNGGFGRDDGNSLSAASLPSYGSGSARWNAQVQPHLSTYFWGSTLNETSLSIERSSSSSAPYLRMPGARVRTTSALDDGSSGTATLQLGGNPSGDRRGSSWSMQLRNETSWMSLDSRHRVRLTVDGSLTRSSSTQSGNRYGTFSFNSLGDFEAGRPATFTRALSSPPTETRSAQWLVGLGDTYRRSPRLQFQYGVQLVGAPVPNRPAYNPVVDSLFDRRTDELPSTVAWSPMASFSWGIGSFGTRTNPRQNLPARATLTGGVSQRRGPVSQGAIESASRQTGLPGDLRSLYCVGDAAPTPDWELYATSVAVIPDRCADGSEGTVLEQSTPGVQLFDPAYQASESWRVNLGLSGRLSTAVRASMSTVFAVNRRQPGTFDLNFDPATHFLLADEGLRPVYVSPASISEATGAVASRESRRFDDFAQVNERRSDLQSRSRQFQVNLSYEPGARPFATSTRVGVTYVRQWARDLVRGFSGSTAGDPRRAEWARSSGESRHQITVNSSLRIPDWVSVDLFTQFTSGRPYTPRVDGDINGDGSSNDRAFVFDPARTTDAETGAAMAAILAAGGAGAECLRRQLGRVAARNSCDGPWTTRLNLSLQVDPRRLGLSPRTRVSLQLNNALFAFDRLVNGNDDLHGWGQSFQPEGTLLNVKAFDAASNRFLYEVNPRFGSTLASRSTSRTPFSVVLDVRFDLGPPPENLALRNLLRARSGDRPGALSAEQIKARFFAPDRSEISSLLQQKDAVDLTDAQVDSLTGMHRGLVAMRDSLFTDLARFLAALPDGRVTNEAGRRFLRANTESQLALARLAPRIKSVLTDEQRRKLPSGITSWLDRDPRAIARRPAEDRP
jgi:hypothetical protein